MVMRGIFRNLNLKLRMSQRAMFSVEYTTLIVLIILALLAMRFYLKRSMCGRVRGAADAFGQGRQYEPGVTVETWN
jgi:uncharacterized protein (UPF0333 family)